MPLFVPFGYVESAMSVASFDQAVAAKADKAKSKINIGILFI
jgi:hypothetical protein